MEKIKNICCDLGRAFTIGLLSGGAAAAVLLLGGFLFGGPLEATKPGSLETFNHPPIPTPSAKVALNSMGKYLFSNFI